MKRILKFLAYLYPSSWRTRYGTEFEALLEERPAGVRDALDVFWGALKMQLTSWPFTRIVLPSCGIGLTVAVAVSFTITPRYVAQTVVTITAVDKSQTADMIARANKAAQIGESDPNGFTATLNKKWLRALILGYNLYPSERSHMPLDPVISKMMTDIDIRLVPKDNRDASELNCIVSFSYTDLHLAQLVDRNLAGRFWQANMPAKPNLTPGQPLDGITPVDGIAYGFKWPSPPQKRIFSKRILFGIFGLLTGLIGGLTLATFLRNTPSPAQ
jgi:hypothetical protein